MAKEKYRADLGKYVVLSIWHGCNSDCSICMLADVKSDMPVVEFEQYRSYVDRIVSERKYESLILSGAEVTTFQDLHRYVEYAASTGYFKKIQIQSNGRKLKNRDYVESLVDAGVNEFFVSVHGLEGSHEEVTRVPGSFGETMEGLDNLEAMGLDLITNTVLTRTNLPDIVPLMNRLSSRRVNELHMWNFYPMESTDSRDLIVKADELVNLLGDLLPVIRRAGKPLILKSFPHCLSFGEPIYFDSVYPATVIPDQFWIKFSESGFGTCVYRERCGDIQCWGLSRAYLGKYGDERDLLSPLRAKN